MERVIITKEEAKAIKRLKQFVQSDEILDCRFTGREIGNIFLHGYEVEPEFEVGDWVYDMHHNKVARIDHRGVDDDRVWVDDDELNFSSIVDIRHATQEEIQQEKERRFFNEHGRKPRELKVGDVLVKKMDNFPLVVTEVNAEEITLNLLTCTRSEVKKRCKVLCFAEKRLDVSAE